MREVIVSEFVTLDGRMEAPGGEPSHPHTGWTVEFGDDAMYAFKHREVLDAHALLLGRVTWESFSGAWPGYSGDFADRMNTMPKYVASATLRDPGWNTTVLRGDVPAAVAALKKTDGGPLLVQGSATLAHTLMRHGLVDEVRLLVFPVTIGSGIPAFPETPQKTTYTLTDLRRFDTGVVLQVHRVR